IGRDVAKAAIEAIERGAWSKSTVVEVKKADLHGPMDNQGYLVLAKLGVFDMIPVPENGATPQFKTWIYAITLGDAQIVTTVALLTGKPPADAACKDVAKHSDFARDLQRQTKAK